MQRLSKSTDFFCATLQHFEKGCKRGTSKSLCKINCSQNVSILLILASYFSNHTAIGVKIRSDYCLKIQFYF